MKEQLLSIEEFAEKAGVNISTIYRNLDGKLKPFLAVQNGKKRLNSAGLALFKKADFSQNSQGENEEIIEILRNTLDFMQQQLNEQNQIKDKQIESLTTALMNEQVLHRETIKALPGMSESEAQQKTDEGELEKLKEELETLRCDKRLTLPADIHGRVMFEKIPHVQNLVEKGKNEVTEQILDIIHCLSVCIDEGSFSVKKVMDKNKIDVNLTRNIPDEEIVDRLIDLIKASIRSGWNMKPRSFFRDEKL